MPTIQKVRNGWGRYLFRRAMEGILPPSLQWQKSKPLTTIIPSVKQEWDTPITLHRYRLNQLAHSEFLQGYFELDELKKVGEELQDIPADQKTGKFASFSYTASLCYALDQWLKSIQ